MFITPTAPQCQVVNSSRPKKFTVSSETKITLEEAGGSPGWRENKLKSQKFALVHYDEKKVIRVNNCGEILVFKTGELKLNLSYSNHCNVRFCPVCELRGAFKMSTNLQKAIDMIKNNNENYTFLFLTLTQKNCPVEDLKDTLKNMSTAWNRWQFMKKNPSIKGYFRSMEITKGADGTAHPHYHAVICVNKSYYSKTYWSSEKWASEWQRVMRLDYLPICDIRKIDMDKNSIKELIKYSVKSSDIFDDPLWFQIVDKQMAKIRRYATGGNIKSALLLVADKEVMDLDNELDKTGQLYFSWDDKPKNYFLND